LNIFNDFASHAGPLLDNDRERAAPAFLKELRDAAISIAYTIDSEIVGLPSQYRAPAHGVGPGVPDPLLGMQINPRSRSRHRLCEEVAVRASSVLGGCFGSIDADVPVLATMSSDAH
jgi:hypothetical protein